ncbi:MAG TPA: ATP-binding cassette domain-containing protein [Abditibacteriaceae bacterium]|jgi:ABC-2 type transport system ATP-binding protein
MIEVENLSKVYGSEYSEPAVRGVSFRVGKGEIVGFLGPNGAGKTTTMRILTCFMAPSAGTARIAGHDILENSLEVRRNIGYLPENAPLYPDMTVLDYLGYIAALRRVPKNKRAERLEAALDAGKLEDRAHTLIHKLSKGYRQRVGIAQAVVHDPPVVILDEPSAGLDPAQRVETRGFIKGLAQEHTVILSTHILPDVQEVCSRVLIIHRGQLVADDTTENLGQSGASNTRIRLVVKRAPQNALEQIRALPEITSARQEEMSATPGEYSFVLDTRDTGGNDPREAVARLCVQGDWGLLELRRERTNLEDLFLRLTAQA